MNKGRRITAEEERALNGRPGTATEGEMMVCDMCGYLCKSAELNCHEDNGAWLCPDCWAEENSCGCSG